MGESLRDEAQAVIDGHLRKARIERIGRALEFIAEKQRLIMSVKSEIDNAEKDIIELESGKSLFDPWQKIPSAFDVK